MDETILYEVDERVATVTLNRPEKLNAITPTLQRELLAALRRAADDDDVRVAVVRGAGRGFCAGYDVTSGEMVAPRRPRRPPAARGRAARVAGDLGPPAAGDRPGARRLPRRRHPAGGDLRHHDRRRRRPRRDAAAPPRRRLRRVVLGVVRRAEEGQGGVLRDRRHGQRRRGGGDGAVQPGRPGRRARRSTSSTTPAPSPASRRTCWRCRSSPSTAPRRPRASARRCSRAPRSTPSPTPRRRSAPSTATSPSTGSRSRWPRSAAAIWSDLV